MTCGVIRGAGFAKVVSAFRKMVKIFVVFSFRYFILNMELLILHHDLWGATELILKVCVLIAETGRFPGVTFQRKYIIA